MTDIKLYGSLIASEDNRTLRYKLLPFGSIGRTNVGAVIASKDSVEIPEDVSHLILNLEHKQMAPVGRFVSVEKGEDALYATVSISKFKRGDEALALTASRELSGISVEIAGAVIQDGKLVGGELTGAALCKTPAFPDALLMASNTEDVEEALNTLSDAVEGLKTALAPVSEAPVEEPVAEEETAVPEETPNSEILEEDEDPLKKKGVFAMESNAIPTALTASNGGSAEITTFEQGTALIAKAVANRDTVLMSALEEVGAIGHRNLFAALSPVPAAAGANAVAPVWLGQAWDGKQYNRKYTTLLTNKPLTGFEMTAWRFTQKPVVSSYAGFPAQIPSGPVGTEQYTITAEEWAGGNDLDLKYRFFNDAAFLQAYFTAQAESYARVTDIRVLNALKAADNTVTRGTAPTGVAQAAVDIVDGALAMIDDATASAAIVPAGMYRELLLTKENDSLQYLQSALNLEGGSLAGFSIVPSSDVTEVIVVSKEAATFYELGGSPIRVQADNPAIGGFTTALFGFTAVDLDTRGVVRVTPSAA